MKCIFLSLLLLLAACGMDISEIPPSGFNLDVSPIRMWLPLCSVPGIEPFPSKMDHTHHAEPCDDNDTLLFAGLLCLSGEEIGCKTVAASQAESGQFFRSPRRLSQIGDSFSRDHALGVLAYLIKTKDVERAEKWLAFIEKTGALCEDGKGGACIISLTMWGTIGKVWTHLGLPQNKLMKLGDYADDSTLVLSAKSAPAGYQLHLVGVQVLLRHAMGKSTRQSIEAAKLLQQRQDQNAFFAFLAGDNEGARRLIEAQAPKSQPEQRQSWSFEENQDAQKWVKTMGWEWVFLANMINGWNLTLHVQESFL